MMFVTDLPGEKPIVWEYLNKKARVPWSTDIHVIGQMRKNGTLAGAVAYNNWVPNACFIHIAVDSEHSMNLSGIREAFRYPFITRGLRALYGLTPISDTPILEFLRRLGFTIKYRDGNFVLHRMLATECRWLKGVNGWAAAQHLQHQTIPAQH